MTDVPAIHSRRTLTLRFEIPTAKTKEFWDSLAKGRFVTSKCSKCGQVSFPPQSDCPKCLASEFEWVEVGQDAALVTFTQVRVPPASFESLAPYTIGIGEFPGGLRVLAWLEGVALEDTKAGMKLRLEPRTSEEGSAYYVFVRA